MVVVNGSKGSICFYWKNILIVGLPHSDKKNLDYYMNQSYDTIRQGFNLNNNIEQQCKAYSKYLKLILQKKKNNEDIDFDDLYVACIAILALVKFKRIDIDDVSLILPRKKSK